MNWKEYQKQSIRTLPSFYNTYGLNVLEYNTHVDKAVINSNKTLCLNADIVHCAIGINTEYEELSKGILHKNFVNISEELADMFWYISGLIYKYKQKGLILTKCINADFSQMGIISRNRIDLANQISLVNDAPKKMLAYKRNYLSENLDNDLYELLDIICSIAKDFSVNIKQCLENNINKLKVRYPEKFTEENAKNRNLNNELKELEK